MPKIRKLGHVALHARDPQLLAAFYRDLFHLTVTARDKTGKMAFLAIDPSVNHHDLAIAAAPGSEHVAFYVDTLAEFRQFHATLRAKGIRILTCQIVMFALRMDFHDPEGNVTEIIWQHGKWGRFPFFHQVDLDTMTDEDILRVVDEMPLEEQAQGQ